MSLRNTCRPIHANILAGVFGEEKQLVVGCDTLCMDDVAGHLDLAGPHCTWLRRSSSVDLQSLKIAYHSCNSRCTVGINADDEKSSLMASFLSASLKFAVPSDQ